MKKILLILGMVFSLLNADGCWSEVELSEMAQDEFDERVRFSIKDAVDCKPIDGAKFYLGKSVFESDKNGMITLPLPPEDMDIELPIKIVKDGYITNKEYLLITFGSFWKTQFLMSKKLPKKSARFVLSWGAKPADLDLHLKSKNYHISYTKTRNVDNTAKLDRDSRNGYGPETITAKKLDQHDEYSLLVYKFTNKGNLNKKAQVSVYLNGELDSVVRLPETDKKCVQIATIKNSQITYETKILDNKFCK